MNIGFIGAGRMGRPMVARLIEAGHDVAALGRSDENRAAIAELGAVATADLQELSAKAEVVVLCVFTDQQVREICLDGGLLSNMAPGSTLVVHTTGGPRTLETLAASGAVDVVDAPVSGGPHNAAAGELTLFVGGTEDAVARVHPVLSCYGDPILHVGGLGAGQKVKLLNNALFAAQIGLLSGAVEVATRLGLSEPTLLAALQHGSGTSRVLDLAAPGGSVASFVQMAGEFVRKDVTVARDVVAELGSDLGVLESVIDVFSPRRINYR